MGCNSTVGRSNWITRFPKSNSKYFSYDSNRMPELFIGKESAIIKNHHIDCNEYNIIGNYVTIAG